MFKTHMLGLLLIFFSMQGQAASQDFIPSDADELEFTMISITMVLPRDHELVEGGLKAAVIVGSEFLVDASTVWSDGTKVASVVSTSNETAKEISHSALETFEKIDPVYTYSIRIQGTDDNPALGMDSWEHTRSLLGTPRASLEMSAIDGDYARKVVLTIPWVEVDQSFWQKMESVLPPKTEYQAIIEKLKFFWKNNSQ